MINKIINNTRMNLSYFLKKEHYILYLIILVGAFLRFQGVFTNSFAFTYDVGRDMLTLWQIVYDHKISLIGQTTGLPGVFYGPWWYYLLAPFFAIFSGNPQGIAGIMSLVGVLSIIFSYILGEKIGNRILGIILVAITAVSPILISWSSQIWNPNIIPVFVLLTLLVLSNIFLSNKNKLKYYFFLGIILALIMDFEIVFGVLFLVSIALSVLVIKKMNIKLSEAIGFFVGGLIILSPRIVFELRHQFLMTKSLINFFSSGDSIGRDSLGKVLINRFSIFFDQFCSTLATDNKLLGIAIFFFILVSLLFLYKKTNSMVKNFIQLSCITLVVFFIGILFFNHDIWPHYLVGLPIFYILLFSLSLYLLSKKLSGNTIPIIIVILVFIINLNPIGVIQNLSKPLWEGDAAVYRNQVGVIDYIYQESNGREFKYVVYTPPVHDYTYRYLFKWYGPNKYKSSPSINSNLAYFILEPDFQNPQRLKDWLKQREGDGRIIKSQEVGGGIVVQTRINK